MLIDATQIRASRALLDISQSGALQIGFSKCDDDQAPRGLAGNSGCSRNGLENSDGAGKGGHRVHTWMTKRALACA